MKAGATKSQRLMQRIRDELGIALTPNARIDRTHAGHWQRSSGAWTWFVFDPECYEAHIGLGGFRTVTELLSAKSLDIEISKATGFYTVEIKP
jgi:hypothetical protein